MNDADDVTPDGVSRRRILRQGAATVGALTLGTAALGGEVAATGEYDEKNGKTGGTALFKKKYFQRKRPWKVVKKVDDDELPASCNASQSAKKKYNFYKIEYKRKTQYGTKHKKKPRTGYIATRKRLYRYENTGQWYRFNSNKHECNDPVRCNYNYKAAFGPAKKKRKKKKKH